MVDSLLPSFSSVPTSVADCPVSDIDHPFGTLVLVSYFEALDHYDAQRAAMPHALDFHLFEQISREQRVLKVTLRQLKEEIRADGRHCLEWILCLQR